MRKIIVNTVFVYAKLRIFGGISKENFQTVNAENAAVAYFAHLAGLEQLDIAPATIKGVAQGYDVAEFEDRAVASPYGNIDGVAGVEHLPRGGDMNGAGHIQEKGNVYSLRKTPGEADRRTTGRLSAYRQVNFAEFGFSPSRAISQSVSVMSTGASSSGSVSSQGFGSKRITSREVNS